MVTTEKLKRYLENIRKKNKEINALLEVRDEKELLNEARKIDEKIKSGKAGRLAGKIIAVKANINVKGMKASCASKVLEDYNAPYDAEVISKIKKEDGLIIGIANMDEFACGFSGETSAFGPTKNPVNHALIPGGTSSGSAAAVAAEFCDMALGTDTGGSIRNPASICGVVGLKPSYGCVSRYGLIDMSMSLDQIGPLARTIEDVALLLDVIRGKDEKDSITEESERINLQEIQKAPKKLRIGVLDLTSLNVDSKIKDIIEKKLTEMSKKHNWEIRKIKIKHLDLAVATYYPLVYAEFYSATRRFDGRKYGKKIEDAAGPEVLRRILGGSEITKAEHMGRHYNSSLKAKRFIEKEFSKSFNDVDCIISPTIPRLPWKIGEKISVEEAYATDALTIPSSLAGNCAISIPAGEINKIPVGMQIICDKFQEQKLLQIARLFFP